MTWREIADEQRAAAQRLLVPKREYPRAACSRAYYAVYALLASKAPSGFGFAHGGNNPSHEQLPEIVRRLQRNDQNDILDLLNRLRDYRILADYGVGRKISVYDARQRVRDCVEVFEKLR